MRNPRPGSAWTPNRWARRGRYADYIHSKAWARRRKWWFREHRERTGQEPACVVCGEPNIDAPPGLRRSRRRGIRRSHPGLPRPPRPHPRSLGRHAAPTKSRKASGITRTDQQYEKPFIALHSQTPVTRIRGLSTRVLRRSATASPWRQAMLQDGTNGGDSDERD